MNDVFVFLFLFGGIAGFVFTLMLPSTRESSNSKFQIVIPIMAFFFSMVGAIGFLLGSNYLCFCIMVGASIVSSVVLHLNIKEISEDKLEEIHTKTLAKGQEAKKIKDEIFIIKKSQDKILDLYDQLNSNDFNVEYATKILVSTKGKITTVKKGNE